MGETERKQNREIRAGPRERKADSDSWAEREGEQPLEKERECENRGETENVRREENETETFRGWSL